MAKGNYGPRHKELRREEYAWGIIWTGTPEQLFEAKAIDRATLEGNAWKPVRRGQQSPSVRLPSGRMGEVIAHGKYRFDIREKYSDEERRQRRQNDDAAERIKILEFAVEQAETRPAVDAAARFAALGDSSPARFKLGDEVLLKSGESVRISKEYAVIYVKECGWRPGYCVTNDDGEEYFRWAGALWDASGNIKHLRLVS